MLIATAPGAITPGPGLNVGDVVTAAVCTRGPCVAATRIFCPKGRPERRVRAPRCAENAQLAGRKGWLAEQALAEGVGWHMRHPRLAVQGAPMDAADPC